MPSSYIFNNSRKSLVSRKVNGTFHTSQSTTFGKQKYIYTLFIPNSLTTLRIRQPEKSGLAEDKTPVCEGDLLDQQYNVNFPKDSP
jgi:hypothetical protein